jgi:hypothetical protein
VKDRTNVGDVSIPRLSASCGCQCQRVDAADVSLVRQQTLQPITTSNFRGDINARDGIDEADVDRAPTNSTSRPKKQTTTYRPQIALTSVVSAISFCM